MYYAIVILFKKWGIQNGSQRYRCSNFGFSFVQKNDTAKVQNSFVWFEKWVLERQVYKYLVRDSKMSQSKLQALFKSYLKSAPVVQIKSKQNVHLLIDATYFPNKLFLVLYYDYDINYVQLYRNTDKEKFKEIKEDLENLKRLNVQVYSVTCDVHRAVLKAVKQVYPNALIQRCLVHIKRQVKTYVSEQPKLSQAKSLLQLSNKITFIKTQEQCSEWLIEFYNWYQLNKNFINEKSINEHPGRMWYTHKKFTWLAA